jgi:hypothetical protein
MGNEPIIEAHPEDEKNRRALYENWCQLAQDRKTLQIVDFWMGGPTGPGRHYVNLPPIVKPDVVIQIFWDPDRLVIREPMLQNDFPNVYTTITILLEPYLEGGKK